MKKNTKLTLTIIATIIAINYYKNDYQYTPRYQILNEDTLAYGQYSNGSIYIGDTTFIKSLSNINENDILVETKEDSMKIYSSYKIHDKNQKNEILNVLYDYKLNNLNTFNRSIESMRIEWFTHNILYYCNYQPTRTKDVDFDNDEENIYNHKIISKI